MKAVILSISPNTTIVDISHEIEKFNIRMGAYILASASQYFPKETIHVAVVDPGVGTKRRPLIIETEKGFFVGPDNGVLALAVGSQGIKCIYEITNPKLMLSRVSSTFHGRDVFAPAAAHLANGVSPAEFGSEIDEIVKPSFASVAKKKNKLVGEVLHIDDFGNIISNFDERDLEWLEMKKTLEIKFDETRLKLKLCKSYAETKKQEPLAIIGSHNFLEISMNQGNAAKIFNVKSGDEVTLYSS
jgi:hypothetical protein